MAANTAFVDLPLLLSILGRDGYVPRQFTHRGKRLSFSNGIVLLFLIASFLVILFDGKTHSLIPLYAVGVFISFTLSQFGMFKKWIKSKEGGWRHKAVINGLGASVTAVTCIIIGASKFFHGAWIVLICIPLLVLIMRRVSRHYSKTRENLKIDTSGKSIIKHEKIINHVIVPVEEINKSFIKSLNYGTAIGSTVEVYNVSTDPEKAAKLREDFMSLDLNIPLIIEEAPYRNINETTIEYINKRQSQLSRNEMITIVMPQFVIDKWWHQALHNQTSLFLRTAMLKKPNISVVTIPFKINE